MAKHLAKKIAEAMKAKSATVSKHALAMRDLGVTLVEKQIEALDTAMTRFLSVKGKSAADVAEVRHGVKAAWTEYREQLTAESGEKQMEKMAIGSIYNRASENDAILSAYETYAGLDKAHKATFDKLEGQCSGYHALVAFARKFNAEKAGKKSKPEATGAAKRERNKWEQHTTKQVNRVKQVLRFATLKGLLLLEDYIGKRIAQETASAKQRSAKQQGAVTKLRKAA